MARKGPPSSSVEPSQRVGGCVFCGAAPLTQEHLVADWAIRAFARQRRPWLLSARLPVSGPARVVNAPPTPSALVTCRGCNNGWISGLDREASAFLKPLIRGDQLRLNRGEQAVAAAWIFKTALVCDAADHGLSGPLGSLRARFMTERRPPLGCNIYAGSTRPYGPAAFPFGVRRVNGVVRLSVNVISPDGRDVSVGAPREIANPAFQVMVGAMTAFIWGPIQPIAAESLIGFERLWPVADTAVTITPLPLPADGADRAVPAGFLYQGTDISKG